MRHAGTILILAGGLAFSALSRADDSVQPGNPYGSIVKRNIFGLNPIPVVDPNAPPPGPPPPKITLTGITTIFGAPEALYKVSGVVRKGKPPQDESYIFVEGESQDDVEVSNIDTARKTVTFINHGEVQVIPLASGVASTGEAPPPPTFTPRAFNRFGAFRRPGMGAPQQNFQPYTPPAPSNGNGQSYNNGNNYNPAGGTSYQGGQNSGLYNPSAASVNAGLSGEDEAALIAAQHAEAEKNNDPIAQIFPPTQFDQEAGVQQSTLNPSSPNNANNTAGNPRSRGANASASGGPPMPP